MRQLFYFSSDGEDVWGVLYHRVIESELRSRSVVVSGVFRGTTGESMAVLGGSGMRTGMGMGTGALEFLLLLFCLLQ